MEYKEIGWKDSLLTCKKLIDSQRREFIGIVKKLLDNPMKFDDAEYMRINNNVKKNHEIHVS
jgi:hypothetical protein